MTTLTWDLFCRVIDNHGDLGVTLRLARQLADQGQRARIWVDNGSALQWMAASEEEQAWAHAWPQAHWAVEKPGDVIIEAFGCHLPDCVQAALAQHPPRAWINLEYLSAEGWVARSHGLMSPVMQGPAAGLSKRFCFPGFGTDTGGLLGPEEPATPALEGRVIDALLLSTSMRNVSLFCYPHAPLSALFQRLADEETQILVLGGAATMTACARAKASLASALARRIQLTPLPFLNQPQYDALLARCDLNVVRGEDSFVRAQWAGRPFLWHIYRQDDGADAAKLEAFLGRWLGPEPSHTDWRRAWRAWNGALPADVLANSKDDGLGAEGRAHALAWRETLRRLPNLVGVLQQWALGNPPPSVPGG